MSVKHRTFFWFILPSLAAMTLFIALPIVSVIVQSLFVEHEQVIVVTESCGPFGCDKSTAIDVAATQKLKEEQPLGRFNGLGTYFDRGHLAVAELAEAWATSDGLGAFAGKVMNLPFYKALAFTLTYTFVVTPLVILFGMAIALGVNGLPRLFKGVTIFVSLLPMIVTPLIGSLILFWMIDARGIIGSSLQSLTGDPSLSLKASPVLTWVTLITYGVWHNAPFAFIVRCSCSSTPMRSPTPIPWPAITQASRLDRARTSPKLRRRTVPSSFSKIRASASGRASACRSQTSTAML